ncbi:hypothetical protein K2X85_10150 [bacterium]|nr:hypothetical protein [bacterium]
MAGSIASQSHHRIKGRFLIPEVRQVLGELRGRVDGDVLALAFTPDHRCLTLEDGGILRQWNPNNGNMTQSVLLSEIETCWAFSRDGRFLASGSDGISIWDANEGELIGKHEDPAWMTALVFSPDSRWLASGHDDHKVRLWDSQRGKLVRVFTGHHDEICALAFSADGRFLASASEDRLVMIWDTKTGDLAGKLEGHTDRVDDLAWNPAGDRIASAGWDTSVRVWDAKTGELLSLLNGQGECVHTVAFTPDGHGIVCGDSNGYLRLWDYKKLKVKGEWHAHRSPLRRLVLSRDGRWAATAGLDRIIQFIPIAAAEPIGTESEARSSVVSIASGTGPAVAISYSEGRLEFFDARTSRSRGIALEGENVLAVASTPAGQIAVGTESGKIALFDRAGITPTTIFEGHVRVPAKLLAIRPDGLEVASSAGSDGMVRLWNPQTGEATLIIPEATNCGTVEAIAYHPTLPIVAASGILWNEGGEGATALWDTKAIKLHLSFARGATSLAFSPDARFLAGVDLENNIVVWDLSTARVVKELSGTDGNTTGIIFDRESEILVSVSDDGGIRSWEVESWRMTGNIEVEARPRTLAFTQDGQTLIVGNANSACYLIDRASLI